MAQLSFRALEKEGIDGNYDLIVGSTGYEARSRYLPLLLRKAGELKLAWSFSDRHECDFGRNEASLKGAGFDTSVVLDEIHEMRTVGALKEALQRTGAPLKIAIDISSMTRTRIANWISSIGSQDGSRIGHVDFLYAIAKYSGPAKSDGPYKHVGPVSPRFAGWSESPHYPTAAIVGLGYEPNRAASALERLEAKRVWLLQASGEDMRYDSAVRNANRELEGYRGDRGVLQYPVREPILCLGILDALVRGASRESRLVLLPFGPKIFALCCLLTATVHSGVAVWRVSGGSTEVPRNRYPSKQVAGIRVTFAEQADDRKRVLETAIG